MEEQRPFELGAVYQAEWSKEPIRVVAFDAAVVFYDIWRPDVGAWALMASKGNFNYYRISAPFLYAHAKYIRTDAYSDTEFARHRPDLPMSFAIAGSVDWSSTPPRDAGELVDMLRQASVDMASASALLELPTLYLEPFGPKGSSLPGVLVTARDGKTFTGAELLLQAWQLQAPNVRESSIVKGLGLHRAGVKKGIPSYYIWGSASRLAEWKRGELH